MAPSKAIIDLNAYAHNIQAAQRLAGTHATVMAVVKANAYGHGLVPIAQQALKSGAKMLGVATLEEGIALRDAGIDAPVLLLVQPALDTLDETVAHDLSVMISDLDTAELLGKQAHRAKTIARIHCKIDTGMGRQGFALKSAHRELQFLTRLSNLDIEGIATHFPIADKLDDPFTLNQIKQFKQLLKVLDRYGIPFEIAHAANSAGLMNYPKSSFDMVRPGLMTYGVLPCENPAQFAQLRPVLRWETRVSQIRDLDAGASVGYGRTYTASEAMRVAVLPIGYADGYPHRLSNRAEVLIHGERCPVRGSVCMDQTIVEIGQKSRVCMGDPVTLIGKDDTEEITVAELARHAETIPYEILTGIGARVERQYLE